MPPWSELKGEGKPFRLNVLTVLFCGFFWFVLFCHQRYFPGVSEGGASSTAVLILMSQTQILSPTQHLGATG